MKLEDLLQLGLENDKAKSILALHKQAIDGNYVPKETFNAERDKVKTLNDTIADRDKQIADLGKFKGTAEELQAKVDALTTQNTADKEAYEAKLKEVQESSAIRTAIGDKVYSVDDIIPRLDRTKLVIADGKVVAGLDEQLKSIQEASPHYFKEVKGDPGKPGMPGGWNPWGNSPREGNKGEEGNAAAEFGKSLAKAQSQGISATQKASEIYFK